MAVPRLQEIALRLQMARHDANVEDLLDNTPPAVRLTVRPWRGPWGDESEEVEGRLELSLAADGQVLARSWLDGSADSPQHEARVLPAKLGAAWLEGTVLDFVARLLRA